MLIKFKRLRSDAWLPAQAYKNDAGLDLYNAESVTIPAGGRAWIPTGIAWEPSAPAVMLVRPRSSMCKLGLDVTEGTIDAGYRGEIVVQVINNSGKQLTLDQHQRIAQAVILPLPKLEFSEVDDLSESHRGSNGFGSSGK